MWGLILNECIKDRHSSAKPIICDISEMVQSRMYVSIIH